MGGLCLAPRGMRILPLAAGAGYWAGDVAGEAAWVWERVPDATFVWELRDGKVITPRSTSTTPKPPKTWGCGSGTGLCRCVEETSAARVSVD